MPLKPFCGAKLALLFHDHLLTYKRDVKSTIPFPGCWDFAGGGREGDETPVECALRELDEEFALRLPPERIEWRRNYPSLARPGWESWFLVGHITQGEIDAIEFGDEGQYWQMMPISDYLKHAEGVWYLQDRLRDYLAQVS